MLCFANQERYASFWLRLVHYFGPSSHLVEELLKQYIRVRLLLLQIRMIFYGFLTMISNSSSREFCMDNPSFFLWIHSMKGLVLKMYLELNMLLPWNASTPFPRVVQTCA